LQLAIVVATPLYGLVADTTGSYRDVWLVMFVVLAAGAIPALLTRDGDRDHVVRTPTGPGCVEI
jgi:MFS-type transporter involved in bile tolerance (Atg22 family)